MSALSAGMSRPGEMILLLVAVLLAACSTRAAPVYEHDTTQIAEYGGDTGCYYNFKRYEEGNRIVTNEPCLNCTCHNRMLMCYLRVCPPFSKAIGQDCTVEKRPDQCCPIITCAEVPVQLLTSTTTSPSTIGSTEVGAHDNYGCHVDKKFFADGAQLPINPRNPCELCYCIRNRTTCVMQECTLRVAGCSPVYVPGVCCPVKYDCEYDEEQSTTTTVSPTTPGLVMTTTVAPGLSEPQCYHDNKVYNDGELMTSTRACEHCYCFRGDIVCAVQDCQPSLKTQGKHCTPLPPPKGKCCPTMYQCDGESSPIQVDDEPTPEDILIPGLYPNDTQSTLPTLGLSDEDDNQQQQVVDAFPGADNVIPEQPGTSDDTVEGTIEQSTGKEDDLAPQTDKPFEQTTLAGESPTERPTGIEEISTEAKPTEASDVDQKPEAGDDLTTYSGGVEPTKIALPEHPEVIDEQQSTTPSEQEELPQKPLEHENDVQTPATVDETKPSEIIEPVVNVDEAKPDESALPTEGVITDEETTTKATILEEVPKPTETTTDTQESDEGSGDEQTPTVTEVLEVDLRQPTEPSPESEKPEGPTSEDQTPAEIPATIEPQATIKPVKGTEPVTESGDIEVEKATAQPTDATISEEDSTKESVAPETEAVPSEETKPVDDSIHFPGEVPLGETSHDGDLPSPDATTVQPTHQEVVPELPTEPVISEEDATKEPAIQVTESDIDQDSVSHDASTVKPAQQEDVPELPTESVPVTESPVDAAHVISESLDESPDEKPISSTVQPTEATIAEEIPTTAEPTDVSGVSIPVELPTEDENLKPATEETVTEEKQPEGPSGIEHPVEPADHDDEHVEDGIPTSGPTGIPMSDRVPVHKAEDKDAVNDMHVTEVYNEVEHTHVPDSLVVDTREQLPSTHTPPVEETTDSEIKPEEGVTVEGEPDKIPHEDQTTLSPVSHEGKPLDTESTTATGLSDTTQGQIEEGTPIPTDQQPTEVTETKPTDHDTDEQHKVEDQIPEEVAKPTESDIPVSESPEVSTEISEAKPEGTDSSVTDASTTIEPTESQKPADDEEHQIPIEEGTSPTKTTPADDGKPSESPVGSDDVSKEEEQQTQEPLISVELPAENIPTEEEPHGAKDKTTEASVVEEGPTGTSVTEEKTTASSATEDKPTEAPVIEEEPSGTSVLTEEPSTTSTPEEKPVESDITDQKPTEASVSQEHLTEGPISNEVPVDVGVTDEEKPTDVSVTEEKPTEASIVQEQETEITGHDEESIKPSDIPVTEEQPTEGSIIEAEQTEGSLIDHKPEEGSVTEEKPTETSVPDEVPTQATIDEQKIVEPSTTDEKPIDASVPEEKPTESSITEEAATQASIDEQKITEEPSITEEKPSDDSIIAEVPTETSISEVSPTEPSIDEQKIIEPSTPDQKPIDVSVVEEKPTETSVLVETSTQAAIDEQKITEPSIADEKPIDVSIITEKPIETSVPEEEPTQPSIVDQKITEPSSDEKPTDTPAAEEKPSEISTGEDQTTVLPIDGTVTEEKPTDASVVIEKVAEATTVTPTESSITDTEPALIPTDSPTKTPGAEEKPIGGEQPTDISEQEPTEISITDNQATEPSSTDKATEPPGVELHPTDTSVPEQKPTEASVAEEEANDTPISTITESAISEEKPTEGSAIAESSTEILGAGEQPSEIPQVEEKPDDSSLTEKPTESSVVDQEPTESSVTVEHPTESSEISEKPEVSSLPEEKPTDISATDNKATESSIAQEPSTPSELDKKPTEPSSADEQPTEAAIDEDKATESSVSTVQPSVVEQEPTEVPAIDDKLTESPATEEKPTEAVIPDERPTEIAVSEEKPTVPSEIPVIKEQATESSVFEGKPTETSDIEELPTETITSEEESGKPAEEPEIPDKKPTEPTIAEEVPTQSVEDVQFPVQSPTDDEQPIVPSEPVQPTEIPSEEAGGEQSTEHERPDSFPAGIPGEGNCLVDGQSFANNSAIPPANLCQIRCNCVSSIVHCDLVECSPPPAHLSNCMPVHTSSESCCPIYSCDSVPTVELESDSQMGEHQTPGYEGVTKPTSSVDEEAPTHKPSVEEHVKEPADNVPTPGIEVDDKTTVRPTEEEAIRPTVPAQAEPESVDTNEIPEQPVVDEEVHTVTPEIVTEVASPIEPQTDKVDTPTDEEQSIIPDEQKTEAPIAPSDIPEKEVTTDEQSLITSAPAAEGTTSATVDEHPGQTPTDIDEQSVIPTSTVTDINVPIIPVDDHKTETTEAAHEHPVEPVTADEGEQTDTTEPQKPTIELETEGVQPTISAGELDVPETQTSSSETPLDSETGKPDIEAVTTIPVVVTQEQEQSTDSVEPSDNVTTGPLIPVKEDGTEQSTVSAEPAVVEEEHEVSSVTGEPEQTPVSIQTTETIIEAQTGKPSVEQQPQPKPQPESDEQSTVSTEAIEEPSHPTDQTDLQQPLGTDRPTGSVDSSTIGTVPEIETPTTTASAEDHPESNALPTDESYLPDHAETSTPTLAGQEDNVEPEGPVPTPVHSDEASTPTSSTDTDVVAPEGSTTGPAIQTDVKIPDSTSSTDQSSIDEQVPTKTSEHDDNEIPITDVGAQETTAPTDQQTSAPAIDEDVQIVEVQPTVGSGITDATKEPAPGGIVDEQTTVPVAPETPETPASGEDIVPVVQTTTGPVSPDETETAAPTASDEGQVVEIEATAGPVTSEHPESPKPTISADGESTTLKGPTYLPAEVDAETQKTPDLEPTAGPAETESVETPEPTLNKEDEVVAEIPTTTSQVMVYNAETTAPSITVGSQTVPTVGETAAPISPESSEPTVSATGKPSVSEQESTEPTTPSGGITIPEHETSPEDDVISTLSGGVEPPVPTVSEGVEAIEHPTTVETSHDDTATTPVEPAVEEGGVEVQKPESISPDHTETPVLSVDEKETTAVQQPVTEPSSVEDHETPAQTVDSEEHPAPTGEPDSKPITPDQTETSVPAVSEENKPVTEQEPTIVPLTHDQTESSVPTEGAEKESITTSQPGIEQVSDSGAETPATTISTEGESISVEGTATSVPVSDDLTKLATTSATPEDHSDVTTPTSISSEGAETSTPATSSGDDVSPVDGSGAGPTLPEDDTEAIVTTEDTNKQTIEGELPTTVHTPHDHEIPVPTTSEEGQTVVDEQPTVEPVSNDDNIEVPAPIGGTPDQTIVAELPTAGPTLTETETPRPTPSEDGQTIVDEQSTVKPVSLDDDTETSAVTTGTPSVEHPETPAPTVIGEEETVVPEHPTDETAGSTVRPSDDTLTVGESTTELSKEDTTSGIESELPAVHPEVEGTPAAESIPEGTTTQSAIAESVKPDSETPATDEPTKQELPVDVVPTEQQPEREPVVSEEGSATETPLIPAEIPVGSTQASLAEGEPTEGTSAAEKPTEIIPSVTEDEKPAVESETPVTQTETPIVKEEKPVVESEIPVVGGETPASEGEKPAVSDDDEVPTKVDQATVTSASAEPAPTTVPEEQTEDDQQQHIQTPDLSGEVPEHPSTDDTEGQLTIGADDHPLSEDTKHTTTPDYFGVPITSTLSPQGSLAYPEHTVSGEDNGHFPINNGSYLTPENEGDDESEDYDEDDQAIYGPGTCRYGGKVFVSAQQIPRDDPCDFCFCFRSDIICLQQTCPPPIPGCHEEPIKGFCCPRYECPVSMAVSLNLTTTTTTTTTTLPPHFLEHAYKGAARRSGCQIRGQAYRVGEVIPSSSGPCLQCTCGGDGNMKCEPRVCSPEPMLRQMIAAATAKRRR